MNGMNDGKGLEGQVVNGQYPLLRYLGGSGNSSVFLTEREQQPRRVAIKLVQTEGDAAGACLSRWEDAAGLAHPHLIRLLEWGRCEMGGSAYVFVVMDLAEENLSQILPDRPLTGEEARGMLPAVVDALRYLHREGFVHGHVRPSNIMAVADQLKISSDGIVSARQAAEANRVASPYDPPEAASAGLSAAGDTWSLAATLVEVLTQLPPDRQGTAGGELPAPFSEIARHGLQRSPEQRWSLDQIAASLDSPPVAPAPEVAPLDASRADDPPPGKTGKIGRLVTAGVLAFLLLTIFAIVKLRQRAPESQEPVSGASQSAAPDRSMTPEPPASAILSAAGGVPASAQDTASVPAPPAPNGAPSNSPGAVVEQVLPEVPRSARSTIQGTVRVEVRVAVDASGKVSDATLVSPGPSRYFANLALQSARKWKFAPAESGSAHSADARIIKFEFRQSGTHAVLSPAAQRDPGA